MNIIPVSIVDNFLPNPDKIREWALTLNYKPDPQGHWPGTRSDEISNINRPFYDFFCKRYFSLFWDVRNDPLTWDSNLGFQKTTKDYGSGWVHSDGQISQLTAIVYLNPNPAPNSGTSIMKLKDPTVLPKPEWHDAKRRQILGERNNPELAKIQEQANSIYEESIRVNNVYNRLITFDAHMHHAAHDYLGGKDNEERLTLVMFVNRIVTPRGPIIRSQSILQ